MPGAGELAHMLEPVLRESCGGRLSSVSWFRADWQRGGAATGYASFDASPGPRRDVVVKLPVGPTEYTVTVALSGADAPTPRVVAHGEALGAYDLAWLVMERVPGEPLATALHKDVFADLCAAAAAFQSHMERAWPLPGASALTSAPQGAVPTPSSTARPTLAPPDPDWAALLDTARHAVKDSRIPESSKWNDVIRHTQKALPAILAAWRARPINAWRHGDLHAGNAMRRPDGSPWGPAGCVLLDFAEVQPGHWVEDAVYLERMHWGRPCADGSGKPALDGVKCVSLLAKARKALSLDTSGDYGALANMRRVLSAATIPAFLDREGGKAHLHVALETLERLLPVVAK